MMPVENIELYNSEKMLSIENCRSIIFDLKEQGKTIGLCHGGFDLVHPGHFKHFEKAKELCDVLIVSITANEFIASRKGDGRPIYTDKLRAYMVASNINVDYVVISPYKKGIEVIEELKPTYYVKGPDFINKTTPGITSEKNAIKETGGKMKYTDKSPMSTTRIINYIKENISEDKVLLLIDRDGTLITHNDFLGKNDYWKEEVKFKKNIIDAILYLQTKHKTTKIVISNQAGVARNYFSEEKLKEINLYLNNLLKEKNIVIDNWQHCPNVDSGYAETKNDIDWNYDFVKEETKRKPNTNMVFDGLNELGRDIKDFKIIIMFGNSKNDELLAENIGGIYIDASLNYNKILKLL